MFTADDAIDLELFALRMLRMIADDMDDDAARARIRDAIALLEEHRP